MDWIIVSIASAAAFAVVSILDKVILTRHSPNPVVFIVLTGVAQVPGASLILFLVPFQQNDMTAIAAAYGSGFLWGASLVIMFWVMSREEVSRVMPVVGTSPIFVAVLAVMFLAEQLSLLHWLAIIVTVAGAGLISLRAKSDMGDTPLLSLSFLFLLGSSLLLAGGQFLTKVSAQDMNVWNLYVLRTAGLSTACILLAFRVSAIGAFRSFFQDRKGVGLVALTEGGFAFVASALTILGIAWGPVSLAVPLMSSRPFFVFVLSILASTSIWPLLNEPLDRATMVQKLVSIAMITAGVSTISIL
jgi:drug/metabolite transporter (DMT)-like permease